MAGRDPAFLYYDADVALDVAHMTRREKGCYLDLVQLYRRYHGYTMVQIRYIFGTDFEECWNAIALVLVLDGEKYHIAWLRNSLENKAKRNKKQRENIQKRWAKSKTTDTTVIPSYNNGITDTIPHPSDVLPIMPFGNTNVIPIIVTETETETKGIEDDVGGVGGAEGEREAIRGPAPPPPIPLPGAMLRIFAQTFPKYPVQEVRDYSACMQLGEQLADLNGWSWESANNGRMPEMLGKWKEIVGWIQTSSWYRTKSLSFLSDKFQDLIQAKNNGSGQPKNLRVVAAGNGQDPTLISTTGFGEI